MCFSLTAGSCPGAALLNTKLCPLPIHPQYMIGEWTNISQWSFLRVCRGVRKDLKTWVRVTIFLFSLRCFMSTAFLTMLLMDDAFMVYRVVISALDR